MPRGPYSANRNTDSGPGEDDVFAGFITEAEYARQRGVSLRTCQRDRALRKAPPYVVVGRAVYYRVDSIRQWLAAHEAPTDQGPRRRRRGR